MYNNYMPNNFGMNNAPMNMSMGQMNMGVNPLSTYQQPQIQTQQPQQQIQQQNTGNPFIMVSNMKEAKEKILPYGSTVWMRDSSDPYLYVKGISLTGDPSFHVLKVEDITDQMLNNNGQTQNNNQFVPIQDFNALNQKVEQLQNSVNYYNDILNKALTPTQQVVEEPKKVGRPSKTEKENNANE